ncbi:TonB-dependent receptor [Emticicia fontis]
MNTRLKQILIFFSVTFLSGSRLYAQKVTALPEVVVIAKPLIEETKVDSFASVSAVISKAQIRDLNAIDLASALRRTPGVQIARYNPVGAFGGDQGGAVFIRGMGVSRPGSEIKTYIDGLPFYMGLWNHPLLDLLPINAVQNVTVYKSPQPHINGNNFASINLTTFNSVADSIKIEGSGRISAGSFGTFVEQVYLAGKAGKVDYNIAQGFARSNGHRPNANGELKNILANVGIHLSSSWRTEFKFLYVNNKASDPGDARTTLPAIAPQYNTEAGMFSIGLIHQYQKLRGRLQIYTNQGMGSWLDLPAPDGNTISHFKTSGLHWNESINPWKLANLIVGLDFDYWQGSADFERIAPAPQTTYNAPDFSITSPYLALTQALLLNDKWQLRPSVSLRYYSHNKFESSFAPQVGISLKSNVFTLFGNLSKGINYPGLEAPLLSSLIAPLGDSWKLLKPEEVNHLEVGIKWSPVANTDLDINLFQDKVKNRYVFGFPPNVPPPPQFINLEDYQIQGLEIGLRQVFAKQWQVFTGITLLDPTISNLPYAPKTAVTLGINGRVKRLRIVFDGQYQSATWALNRTRSAGDINGERVSGFTVINTRISYKLPILGQQGEIFTAIENLFNTSYAYRPGYVMPGRWIQIGVSASFAKIGLK